MRPRRTLAAAALGAAALSAATADHITITTSQVGRDGVAGHTTYQLTAQLTATQTSLYAVYGDTTHHMLVPGAYQAAAPFGANIGGTNPQFWSYAADAQYDSWVTVTTDDGSAKEGLTSIGIDWHSWTADVGLDIADGAVFWMNPINAPPAVAGGVLLAQLTVPDGTSYSGLINAQGKSAAGADDWDVTCIPYFILPSDSAFLPDPQPPLAGSCDGTTPLDPNANDPYAQHPPPPPPAGKPSTGGDGGRGGRGTGGTGQAGAGSKTCPGDTLSARLESVQTSCCSQFGEDQDCANGMPTVCDVRCAEVFLSIWADCKDYLQTLPGWDALAAQCLMEHTGNAVHDTDYNTPGDQFDPSVPLVSHVDCDGQTLTTAGELNDALGPFDRLWMVGVAGETTCMHKACPACTGGYTTHAEFLACPGKVNEDTVLNGLLNRWNGTDFSEDTNHDGDIDGNADTGHDDMWHGGMFGAIFSKDAIYWLATNPAFDQLVTYIECDTVVGRR